MSARWKLVDELTVADLELHPVWEFIPENEEGVPDETAMRPVTELPVTDALGKIFGTRIRLHNGTYQWVTLGNISLRNLRATKQCLLVSFEKDGH